MFQISLIESKETAIRFHSIVKLVEMINTPEPMILLHHTSQKRMKRYGGPVSSLSLNLLLASLPSREMALYMLRFSLRSIILQKRRAAFL